MFFTAKRAWGQIGVKLKIKSEAKKKKKCQSCIYIFTYGPKDNRRVKITISFCSLGLCCPHFNALFFIFCSEFFPPINFGYVMSKVEWLICTHLIK